MTNLIERALLLERLLLPENAIEVYLDHLKTDPYCEAALLGAVRCLLDFEQGDKAVRLLPQLLNKGADSSKISLCAEALTQVGLPGISRKILQLYLQSNNDTVGAISQLLNSIINGSIPTDANLPSFVRNKPLSLPELPLKYYSEMVWSVKEVSLVEPLRFLQNNLVSSSCFLNASLSSELNEYADKIFTLCEPEDAEALMFPNYWLRLIDERIAAACTAAAQLKKPVLIFSLGDLSDTIGDENALVFQTSLYQSTRRPNDFSRPAIIEDILANYCGGVHRAIPKGEKPHVSFCGQPIKEKRHIRNIALALLGLEPRIQTTYDIQTAYRAGIPDGAPHYVWLERRIKFMELLLHAPYTLVVRGGGNFSIRLFEVMSAGRIPIIVNSNCVYPSDDRIDWKSVGVWIEMEDVGKITEIVLDFHNSISPEEFIELQWRNRLIWEEYLSLTSFWCEVARITREKIAHGTTR